VYYLLPGTAQDNLSTALALPGPAGSQMGAFLSQALESDLLPDEDALIDAVTRGDYKAGVVLSDEAIAAIEREAPIRVPVYLAPGASPDLRQAVNDIYTAGLNNLSFTSTARQINIDEQLVVLGPDMLGIQRPIALRDRMLPLLLLLVFSIELMGLANLISDEVEKGTVRALLVTPMSIGQFFISKTLMGVGMAFTQAIILVLAAGKLTVSPLVVAGTLLIGSFMLTGLAFVIASIARDLLSVLAWSTLFLLLLVLPGLGVVFPTMAAGWIRIIPSFYLVDSLHRAFNYSAGWADLVNNLLILSMSGLLLIALGSALLHRRFR